MIQEAGLPGKVDDKTKPRRNATFTDNTQYLFLATFLLSSSKYAALEVGSSSACMSETPATTSFRKSNIFTLVMHSFLKANRWSLTGRSNKIPSFGFNLRINLGSLRFSENAQHQFLNIVCKTTNPTCCKASVWACSTPIDIARPKYRKLTVTQELFSLHKHHSLVWSFRNRICQPAQRFQFSTIKSLATQQQWMPARNHLHLDFRTCVVRPGSNLHQTTSFEQHFRLRSYLHICLDNY